MPIRFTCEECGKALKVSDKNAGKRAACPACQAIIRVPADDEEEERPRPKKKTARTGARRRQAAPSEDDEQEEEVAAPVEAAPPVAEDEEHEEQEEDEKKPSVENRRRRSKRPRRDEDEPVEKEASEEEDSAAAEPPQEELQEEEAEAPADEETDQERDQEESASLAAEPTETDADDWDQEAAEPEEAVGPPLRRRNRRRPARRAGGFGLASVIIGALGLALCWLPFFGIPLAGFGLTLGILGMWIAARGGRRDRLTVAGATISLLAVIPGTLIALGVFSRSSKTVASAAPAADTSNGNMAVQTSPQPISLPAVPKPPAIPDAELVEFKKRMLAFVDEAAALAELAQVKPDATEFGKKVDALTETYSDIPDEPAGTEALDKARTIAHQIWSELRGCRQTLQLADRVKQLGGEDAYRQTLEKLRQWGQAQKPRLEAIRTALATADQTAEHASGGG